MSPISRSLITFLALSSSIPLSSGRLLRGRHTLIPKQATPGFQCEYPTGWTSCNTPENRSCWVKDPSGNIFDINTDYETQIPQGKERTYELELTEEEISPDGTPKLAKLINGKYPGELTRRPCQWIVVLLVGSEFFTLTIRLSPQQASISHLYDFHVSLLTVTSN
jgi:hypothetical protein